MYLYLELLVLDLTLDLGLMAFICHTALFPSLLFRLNWESSVVPDGGAFYITLDIHCSQPPVIKTRLMARAKENQ